jgi:predicted phage baseplate assembly protein
VVGSDPATGEETPTPPTVAAVRPNTQWAYNERTVEEGIGESDGSPDQTLSCTHVPITSAEVWVNEAGSLSGAKQDALADERPDDVRREEGTDEEFWVRWEEVSDFLDSDGSARHYRLDRTSGTVRFGDGQEGAIPPTGEENVEAVYQTGGGSEGNVDAGAVTALRSSISRIDEVTNRRPSDGGTDVESLDGAVERAPQAIKNRGRAVSAEDFEQIAKESSRQLATVRCEPEMDETGDRTPGWVTLLIIPRERRARPTPSLELRQQVTEAVGERAPATLVGHETKRIVVRGPDYTEVSVETTVDTRGVESVTNLKNTVEETLEAFFHPLTGGRDGEGWAFGRAPKLSQLRTLVEGTQGVDRVREMAMTIETASEEKIIRDPEKTPVLARDEMISSGTHEVNVIMGGHR